MTTATKENKKAETLAKKENLHQKVLALRVDIEQEQRWSNESKFHDKKYLKNFIESEKDALRSINRLNTMLMFL